MAQQLYNIGGAYYYDSSGAKRANYADQQAYESSQAQGLIDQARADPANKTMASDYTKPYAQSQPAPTGTNTGGVPKIDTTWTGRSGGVFTLPDGTKLNYDGSTVNLMTQLDKYYGKGGWTPAQASKPVANSGKLYTDPKGNQIQYDGTEEGLKWALNNHYNNSAGSGWNEQSESWWGQGLQDILSQIQNGQVSGDEDITQDPLYEATMNAANLQADRASQKALEQMNSKGILNSTIAGDRTAQIRQDAITSVLPALMEKIYGIKQDQMNNMINIAQLYGSMENAYQSQQLQRGQLDVQKQSMVLEQQQNQIANALAITQAAGFVTNEASKILGIPAGSPTWAAKKAADEMNWDIEKQKQEMDYKYWYANEQFSRMGSGGGGGGGGGGGYASGGDDGDAPYWKFTPDNVVNALADINAGNESVQSVEQDITTRYKLGQMSAGEYDQWMRQLRPDLIEKYSPTAQKQVLNGAEYGGR